MEIYWIRAQAPRRVLALVKYLQLDADFIELDLKGGGLRTPDFTALNPNQKVPTLVDGERVIWESSAIMVYLCGKSGSDLWPAADVAEQVEVLRWLSWNDGHWSPAVAPFYFEHVVKTTFGFGTADSELLSASLPGFHKFARVLDHHLAARPYVACGRLTIADFQLASMATDWHRSEMPMNDYPHIVRWINALEQIPAWADPWPA